MRHTLLDELLAWMDGQGLGAGPASEVVELAGGTQNLMLRFRRGGQAFVLRQPPSSGAKGQETVARETRVLATLAGSDVPHPRLIAASLDAEALGGAFYLMEAVRGFNAGVGVPPSHADARTRRAMGFALVDGLLALSNLDHRAVGLADFGRPEGFLERQVPRWLAQLAGYARYEGWPGASALPGVDRIAGWLAKHRPDRWTPGILHGDFHLSNVMFREDGPGLAAIIDWEMCTIGDPLLDLGWVLATRPESEADIAPGSPSEAWRGLPSSDELIAHYRAGSARDLSAVDWYVVLAGFKLAVVLEGTHARACAGKADRATGDRLHRRAVGLLARAARLAA